MSEKLLQLNYNMTLDEISEGFKLFWKKYQFKKCVIYTIVYAIALVLGIDFIIKNHENFYGYMLIGISVGLIFFNWYRPVMVRKKMLDTISGLAEENYITEIYSDRIKITTEILDEPKEKENSGEDSKEEENGEEAPKESVTELLFGSDTLDALENERMFLLFVNRSLIYIYPKRCLDKESQDKLRQIFTEKAIL